MQEGFLKPVIVAGELLWFSYVDLFYYVAAIRLYRHSIIGDFSRLSCLLKT